MGQLDTVGQNDVVGGRVMDEEGKSDGNCEGWSVVVGDADGVYGDVHEGGRISINKWWRWGENVRYIHTL